LAKDRQTNEQMDSSDALSHSRCRERRLNKTDAGEQTSVTSYGVCELGLLGQQ